MATFTDAELAPTGQKFVHKVIAQTAKELAGEFWDQMCDGARVRGKLTPRTQKAANKFRNAWPDQQVFIDQRWPAFIEAARGAITILLNKPEISEVMKAEIYDVIRQEALVNPKRLNPAAAITMPEKANR